VYLHLVAKQAPKEQFARSEDRRGYLFWQLQRGVVAAVQSVSRMPGIRGLQMD